MKQPEIKGMDYYIDWGVVVKFLDKH